MGVIFMETYHEQEEIQGKTWSGENLEEMEWVDCTFSNCLWTACDFYKVRFVDCKFLDCQMDQCSFTASEMQHASFSRCTLLGINWEELKPSGRLATPILTMESCQIKYNQFVKMPLDQVKFTESTMVQCMFADCSLKNGSFSGANLRGTEFFQCDLRKCNFQQATAYIIDVMSCQLKDAKFSMPEVLNLLDVFELKID